MNESPVTLQIAAAARGEAAPSADQVRVWARAALRAGGADGKRGELTVRVVGRDEMIDLNQRYRGARGATDVLSFPFEADGDVPLDILGDVVICAPVVAAQAASLRVALMRHWAHMVIHGALHLCGWDHQRDEEAARMERIERDLLDGFGL